jgi:hypothetical protein
MNRVNINRTSNLQIYSITQAWYREISRQPEPTQQESINNPQIYSNPLRNPSEQTTTDLRCGRKRTGEARDRKLPYLERRTREPSLRSGRRSIPRWDWGLDWICVERRRGGWVFIGGSGGREEESRESTPRLKTTGADRRRGKGQRRCRCETQSSRRQWTAIPSFLVTASRPNGSVLVS